MKQRQKEDPGVRVQFQERSGQASGESLSQSHPSKEFLISKLRAFLGFLPALNHRLRAARGKQGLGANAVQADMRTEGEMGRSVGKKKMRENLGME